MLLVCPIILICLLVSHYMRHYCGELNHLCSRDRSSQPDSSSDKPSQEARSTENLKPALKTSKTGASTLDEERRERIRNRKKTPAVRRASTSPKKARPSTKSKSPEKQATKKTVTRKPKKQQHQEWKVRYLWRLRSTVYFVGQLSALRPRYGFSEPDTAVETPIWSGHRDLIKNAYLALSTIATLISSNLHLDVHYLPYTRINFRSDRHPRRHDLAHNTTSP